MLPTATKGVARECRAFGLRLFLIVNPEPLQGVILSSALLGSVYPWKGYIMTDTTYLYDTREAWLHAFLDAASPLFAEHGFPLPDNIRISVSEPMASKRGVGAIGKCYPPSMSASGHYEIFLNPVLEGEARIADVLTHEACHTVTSDGHGKAFETIARAMGLEGKLTATVAGPQWFAWAQPILEALGPMPYASMSAAKRKVKKTYLLKLECPDCGWLARVTAKHAHDGMTCPVPDCDGELIVEAPESEAE